MERRPRLAGFAGQVLQEQIEHHVGEEEKRLNLSWVDIGEVGRFPLLTSPSSHPCYPCACNSTDFHCYREAIRPVALSRW